MIELGRDVCGSLELAAQREWLVTNGIGGYALGTVAGLLTRRYHGLLIAALKPPLGRTLLVAKFDETAIYDARTYPLSANRWASGAVDAEGLRYLERFHLEGTTPAWTFAFADALLEKRVWMQPGANTTYVRYDLRRGTGPLSLSVKALVNYRDHHGNTHAGGWRMHIEPVERGLRVLAFDGATPFFVLSDRAQAAPVHEWYQDFFLSMEDDRGLDAREDHLHAGTFSVTLGPGEKVTFVASTEQAPGLDGAAAYGERQSYEQRLILHAQREEAPISYGGDPAKLGAVPTPKEASSPRRKSGTSSSPTRSHSNAPPWIRQLALAADQFIVRRPTADDPEGRTVIAGYPWFSDWGRDTMISLPGLTLATGRADVAERILRTFARCVDRGMLPNRFPEAGDPPNPCASISDRGRGPGPELRSGLREAGAAPEYNTVDATLWYFEAVRAYHAATGDDDLVAELFPTLAEIIAWHQRGTRHNIHVDPGDGLLWAGESGVQLTWMDAKIGDWVVTPRIGKPVEINALWYNALEIMAGFARGLGLARGSPLAAASCALRAASKYEAMAEQAKAGFDRFWNEAAGYCYDVIDGAEGHDASLRPNQLLAVSLPHSPLDARQQRAVVDVCARHLLTSHGLRSLAPDDPAYMGHYGGDQRQRDSAYHQGTVWAWLIGPFVMAHLRVYGDPKLAGSFLEPLVLHLSAAGSLSPERSSGPGPRPRSEIEAQGLGSIGEIFDGDPPHAPRGCIAQAWSVAEVLRAGACSRLAARRCELRASRCEQGGNRE